MTNPKNSKSITVTIKYDERLRKITKVKEETCIIGTGSTFEWLFETVYTSYPEIFKKYSPGAIGFLLNNKPIDRPVVSLLNGDTITFYCL